MSAEQTKGIDVRCSGCGASTTMAWRPGAKCPECASTDIQPVTKIQVGAPAAEPVRAAQKGSGPNPLVVVVLIAVIAIALGFFVKTLLPKRRAPQYVYWLCEKCNIEFTDLPQAASRECPDCSGEAYRVAKYYCEVHEHEFDRYISKPEAESFALWQAKMKEYEEGTRDGRMPPPMGPMYTLLYKMPGSDEWTDEFPREFCCPQNNCDRKTLKYVRAQ